MKTLLALTAVCLVGCSCLTKSLTQGPEGERKLQPWVEKAVKTADDVASAAGVPWAHTIAEGLLGSLTVWLGLENRRHKQTLKNLTSQDSQAQGRLAA